jgi:photosystem II stability/assembly factor-like uncharacterized protein
MAAKYSICLGTVGWGVWYSPDSGESWRRHRPPFPLNSRIQALVAHPTQPHTIYAGGDTGLYVSHDRGSRWERVGNQGDIPTIWSLAIDPVDPLILYAGTRPSGIYRSTDGGQRWKRVDQGIAAQCVIGETFVTALVVDPTDHMTVWAGVEIDGVFRSRDGGESWTRLSTGLHDPDIHDMKLALTQPRRLYASTASEFFVSENDGDSWRAIGIRGKWPLPYARGMLVKADDPGVLYAGCGQITTGEKGHVLRSTTFGETWETLRLPNEANGTIWGMAGNPADPNCIVAFTLLGQVYITDDAGASWRKVGRDFGEIRTAVWVPN